MRPKPLRTLLKETGTSAFLICHPANIRYLSGARVLSGYLLVTERRSQLFVDALSRTQAECEAFPGISVRDRADLARALKQESECALEADHLTVSRKRMLKKLAPHMRLVDKGGVVECYRRQKDEGEIKLIRRAQRITKELLRRVPSALRPGITEEKLARQLQIWALELGADCLSFDAIVAFGTHTGFPHHVPTSRTLKKGHIVQIDVGATVRGYCSDMSRVFFTAPPTPQQKLVYDTLLKAQKRAMDAVKPGVGTAELDRLAREVLKSQGIEEAFCHSLGHGVGLEIHEGITLSQLRKSVELLQGEVITIEPGVYFPGKFGMRIEDMVIV